jgi:NAD(P)-dependent dehydrogenase (short-subunit alcohol dehydrogenase family)
VQISLKGKHVFVTAGAAGMGRATVLAMHELGAHVSTCDVDEDALASLPSEVETFVCDVSDSSTLNRVFDTILPNGLDILINNAGISGPTKLVEEISDEEWRSCMAVGIDAQFYCVRRAVPIFKAQNSGVIINLISGAGIMGYPTRSPYVAAKWAVSGFTQTLAMELGASNIRVNGIVPGNVSGERMDRVVAAHAKAENIDPVEVRRLYAIGTSMQCEVDPQEIADMICYLCSDYGKHVSGQIIGVDGNTETLYPRS